MITVTAGTKKLTLFGSIKELPIARHKLMQSYLLQDSGIGNTIEALDTRFSKMINLMSAEKYAEATEELKNTRLSFFATLSKIDFKCNAFACFVYKIGKEVTDDLSSDGITRVVKELEKITNEKLEELWDQVKKKLIPNYEPTFQDGSEMMLSSLTS